MVPNAGDGAIRAGDLVQIVHVGCACNEYVLGIIRGVDSLHVNTVWCNCDHYRWFCQFAHLEGDLNVPIAWLKRINPPAVHESVERVDEVTT